MRQYHPLINTYTKFFSLLCLVSISGLLFSCEPEEEEVPVIQVDAAYEFSRNVIFSGDTIQFFDKSTGNPSSWSWEFQGGTPSTSTEKNPMVVYDRIGQFDVRLVVSNGDTESSRRSVDQIEVKNINTPPFDGTVWVDPNMITPDDPSTYKSKQYVGQEMRTMFDRRVNDWIEVNAHVFTASFEDRHTVDIQVNPEFPLPTAEKHAEDYARYAGQLPTFLFKDLKTISIHDGNESYGGGNNDILVHVKLGEQSPDFIEELMLHEGGHVSIQNLHFDNDYIAARRMDPTALSTYARDNINREDVAETIGPYLIYRYKPERLTDNMRYTLSKIIPNRMKFFDDQNYDAYPLDQ